MSSKVTQCLVDEAILSVMQISRWFGVAPVRFTRSHITRTTLMYISRAFVIYGMIFIAIIDILTTWTMYLDIMKSIPFLNKPNLLGRYLALRICNFFISTSLVTYGVIKGTKRTNCFIYCVESLGKIKTSLSNNQENIAKWKIFVLTITLLLSTWTLKAIDLWIYYESTQVDLRHLLLSILIMMEMQFVIIAMSIKSGFQVINKCLQNVISYLDQDNLKQPIETVNAAIDLIRTTDYRHPDRTMEEKRQKLAQTVQELSQSYVGVCDVLREFNSSESTITFLQLATQTLHIIITFFNLVRTMHFQKQEVIWKRDELTLQCIWLFYNILKMIVLVEPCCRTVQEAAKTRLLLGKIMCHVTSEADPLHDEVEYFYSHILLNEVSYTAFGIFSLGRPLISKIIGGATTILVLFF